jgi:hypothetical protein
MKITKKVDLGEYIVLINYDKKNGLINIDLLDELEGLIESITVINSENSDEITLDPNLN